MPKFRNRYIDFFKNLILSPLRENLWFFVTIVLLTSTYDVLGFILVKRSLYFVTLLCWDIFSAYILTLPVYVLRRFGVLAKIYQYLVIIISLVLCIIDVVCWRYVGCDFNADFPDTVKETNISESLEFANAVFRIGPFIQFIILLLLTYFVARAIKRSKIKDRVTYTLLTVVAASTIVCCVKHIYPEDFSIGKAYVWCTSFATTIPDLNQYPTTQQVIYDESDMPSDLVIIIGESCSRLHCSLYGYDKPTNPLLTQLRDSDNLIVFDDVVSAQVYTNGSIRDIFTDHGGVSDTRKWWECTKLIDVLNRAGFDTYWVSNQSPTGMYGNATRAISEQTDSQIFIGQTNVMSFKHDFDEGLIAPLDSMIKVNNMAHNVYFVHLIGSHYVYDMRYPKAFDRFTESEYSEYPEHQRHNRATYDNSVLYNDYVVTSIINLFKDKDALVIYFSDHGEDVYQTNPDITGHGRITDPQSVKVTKMIPFVVYPSDTYAAKHQDKVELIKRLSTQHLDTNYFMDLLFDICSIKLQESK